MPFEGLLETQNHDTVPAHSLTPNPGRQHVGLQTLRQRVSIAERALYIVLCCEVRADRSVLRCALLC